MRAQIRVVWKGSFLKRNALEVKFDNVIRSTCCVRVRQQMQGTPADVCLIPLADDALSADATSWNMRGMTANA